MTSGEKSKKIPYGIIFYLPFTNYTTIAIVKIQKAYMHTNIQYNMLIYYRKLYFYKQKSI